MSRFISCRQEKTGAAERNYEGAARAAGLIIILLLLHLVRSPRTHFAPANNGLITECDGAESGR